MASRLRQHVRVAAPRAEVVRRWLEEFPEHAPLPPGARVQADPAASAPPSRLGWRSEDGSQTGAVTFADVNRALTAIRLDVRLRRRGPVEWLLVAAGVPHRRLRRGLRRFVAAQPAVEGDARDPAVEASVHGAAGGERAVAAVDVPPPPVGVPAHLGVAAASAHASGSPGGTGSLGTTSDRVDLGGRVGPAEVAAVPEVEGGVHRRP